MDTTQQSQQSKSPKRAFLFAAPGTLRLVTDVSLFGRLDRLCYSSAYLPKGVNYCVEYKTPRLRGRYPTSSFSRSGIIIRDLPAAVVSWNSGTWKSAGAISQLAVYQIKRAHSPPSDMPTLPSKRHRVLSFLIREP